MFRELHWYYTISQAGIVTALHHTCRCWIHNGSKYLLPGSGIGSDVGIGTYIFNEIVVGSSSSTTARVKEWNSTSGTLEISIVDGNFTPGEIIVGQESDSQIQT